MAVKTRVAVVHEEGGGMVKVDIDPPAGLGLANALSYADAASLLIVPCAAHRLLCLMSSSCLALLLLPVLLVPQPETHCQTVFMEFSPCVFSPEIYSFRSSVCL